MWYQIKTLRLATSYISYLMGVLESDLLEPAEGFRAELAGQGRRSRGQGGAGKKGNNNNNGETNNCQVRDKKIVLDNSQFNFGSVTFYVCSRRKNYF